MLPPRFLRGPVGRSEKPGGITSRSLALHARRAAAPVGCSLSPRAPPNLNLRAAALRAAALRALRAWRGGAAIKLGGLVAAPPLPPLWLSVGGWWSVPPLAVGGCLRSAVCPSRVAKVTGPRLRRGPSLGRHSRFFGQDQRNGATSSCCISLWVIPSGMRGEWPHFEPQLMPNWGRNGVKLSRVRLQEGYNEALRDGL